MRSKRVFIGLAISAASTLMLAACGASTPTGAGTPGGNAQAGKTVFDANCSACHPNGGAGVGPALKGKEPDVVKKQVRNGGQKMPPIPADKITDKQLEDIIAFIKTLK